MSVEKPLLLLPDNRATLALGTPALKAARDETSGATGPLARQARR